MIVRRAEMSDAPALLEISNSITDGMTTMPKDLDAWQRKLSQVESSMSDENQSGQGLYFLVLEDQATGALAGTAAVHAGVGKDRPFYTYKLTKHVRASAELGIQIHGDMLNLVNDFTGDTELGSLYIKPEFRGTGAGRLLTASRILLLGEFPERFGERVFAEIRGWLDEKGESPFWENLGKKFFNLSYAEADSTSAVKGVQFISDLMPRLPIYLELLPEKAINVIGVPHKDSAAAKKYMQEEGFRYQGSIDIFDAGPVMECERSQIASLQKIRSVTIESSSLEDLSEKDAPLARYLISNGDISNYHIADISAEIMDDNRILISPKTMSDLHLEPGQVVNVMQLGKAL